jgi:hypothetical protein
MLLVTNGTIKVLRLPEHAAALQHSISLVRRERLPGMDN